MRPPAYRARWQQASTRRSVSSAIPKLGPQQRLLPNRSKRGVSTQWDVNARPWSVAVKEAVHDQNLKQCLDTERRAWPLVASGQEVFCQAVACFDAGEPEMAWSGKVRDVSPGGIGLILGRRFEPGTALILELARDADESRRLLVRVVHATRETKRRWIVGCAYAYALSQEELRTFLSESPLPYRP
jgi:PilZ domain